MTSRLLLLVVVAFVQGLRDSLPEWRDSTPDVPRGRRKLTVTTLLQTPYVMVRRDTRMLTGNDRFEGFLSDVMTYVARGMDVDYELRMSYDGVIGELAENGTWSGVLGELASGRADLALAAVTVTPERSTSFSFTEPFMTFRSTACIRRPRKAGRRLRTVMELARSRMVFGVISGSETQRLLEGSNNQTYRNMWSRMNTQWPHALVHSVHEGLGKVRKQNFALILDSPMAEYVATRKPCDMYTIRPFLKLRRYAFAVTKNSSLLENVNRQLLRMKESSLMQSMFHKWWKSKCTGRKYKQGTRTANVSTSTVTSPSPWRYATDSSFYRKRNSNSRAAGWHAEMPVFGLVLLRKLAVE